MIITVTCNPAIDQTVSKDGTVLDIGGKGINVSKVLRNMECESLCTGLIGRDNCDIILNGLDRLGIPHHFIKTDGKVRTNLKKIIDGELYEENRPGPDLAKEDSEKLFDYLGGFQNEIVVISGSAPANAEDDLYRKMTELLKRNGNTVILDCSGRKLQEGVKAFPDVIKPNDKEICELFGKRLEEDAMIDACLGLGIPFVIISLGKEGALFIRDGQVYRCPAVSTEVVSPLGAGDSMVAAVAYALQKGLDPEETITLAMACAAASVRSPGSSAPSFRDIRNLKKEVIIEKIRSVPLSQ
ncbi:MAG: 1-phosphofructokinase family hexose kinase [Erysipelotrichaceae bacterium]|nr:1-phosphofructokinase family hexose kinase [Erysipelotrichaceae bacterium]